MAFNPANRHQRICFTANIPDGKSFTDFPMSGLRARLNPVFMIAQPEMGQHRHWQGYFELDKRTVGTTILKHFERWGIKAHLEVAKGTAAQNIAYCSKDETCSDPTLRFTFGEPKAGQGDRTDLATMVAAMREGATDLELLEMDTRNFMIHNKAFALVRQMLAPPRTEPSKLLFMWGATGFGKTAQAMTLNPEHVEWEGGRFLMGYTGQNSTVLFDDFDWSKMSVKLFLRVIDRYPVTIGIKGSQMNFAPKVIVFTSNDDPKTWWPEEPEATREAVHRRMEEFGEIRHFGTKVPYNQQTLTSFFVPARKAYTTTATGTSSAGPSAGRTVAPRRVVESTPASVVEGTQPTQEVTFGEVITLDSDDEGPGLIHEDSMDDYSEDELEMANLDGRIVPAKGKGKRAAEH